MTAHAPSVQMVDNTVKVDKDEEDVVDMKFSKTYVKDNDAAAI